MTEAQAAAIVLLLAVALDLAFGDPPNRYHPVAWIGRALAIGRRRLCHGRPLALLARGAVLALGVAALAGGAGLALDAVAGRLGIAGLLLQAVALKSTLGLRGLAEAATRVAAALERGDLAAARALVGRDLVSRATEDLDERQVTSAAVESTAENLTDGFVAPLCCFLLFGLPGALVYRAINTADAILGYREGPLEHFGKVAARLDDILNLIPARLSAYAIVLGAPLGGGDVRRALSVMRRDRRLTASPNAGWTMAAMAGALGVALEKSGAYRLGDGRLPTAPHIRRGVRVVVSAAAILLIVGLALGLLTLAMSNS